jgi:hypothetical protein
VGYAAGDTNLYRYASNSPTNDTDPSGLQEPQTGGVSAGNPGQGFFPYAPPSNPSLFGPLPPLGNKAVGEIQNPSNAIHLQQAINAARGTIVFPFWFNRCHAWVGAARDRIVGLGKPYYDNDEYVITYVDWDLTNSTGHGGLRIVIKRTGHVYYLDIGTLGGEGGVFENVPKSYGDPHGTFPLCPRQPVPFWPWDD